MPKDEALAMGFVTQSVPQTAWPALIEAEFERTPDATRALLHTALDDRSRLVYSETPWESLVDPESATLPWFRRPVPLAGVALVMVIVLNTLFA